MLPLHMMNALRFNKAIIGTLLFMYSIGALCMRPFSGWIVDNFPRSRVQSITLTLLGVAFLCLRNETRKTSKLTTGAK